MERDYIEMTSSLITIIVSIIAVAVFIYYGGNALFYAVVVIAILVAAFNAWLLSNQGSLKGIAERIGKAEPSVPEPSPRRRAARKRKR